MNHYERLKVSQDAPPEVIRAAYRALAAKLHPDRQQGVVTAGPDDVVHSQMAALNQAYEVLIDPKLRQDYDATLAPARARVSEEPELDSLPESVQGPSTRVDMDWLVPKPPASSLHWPPSRRMMILGGGGVAVLTLVGGSWLWQIQGQHQVERALSRQYSTQAGDASADMAAADAPAQSGPQTDGGKTAAEQIIDRELAAVRREGSTSSGGRHRPTAEELSRMSDEELLKVLPTLDSQDGGAEVAALLAQQQGKRGTSAGGARVSSRHPLDGKPLNLRTDTRIVETLPSTPDSGGAKTRTKP